MFKVKISISSAYFSAVDTMGDFFNIIGRFLPFVAGSNRPVALDRRAPSPAKKGPLIGLAGNSNATLVYTSG